MQSQDWQLMKDKTICKNKQAKSYSLKLGHCLKVMKSRMEGLPNFSFKIQDKPIEVLEAIIIEMHDPERNKSPHALLTEAMGRV